MGAPPPPAWARHDAPPNWPRPTRRHPRTLEELEAREGLADPLAVDRALEEAFYDLRPEWELDR